MDKQAIQGVFLLHTQFSQNRLWIHPQPDHNEEEDE